ncbi:MAG: SH3 domain-containing protein, partial [Rhodospirillaceae bacterium]
VPPPVLQPVIPQPLAALATPAPALPAPPPAVPAPVPPPAAAKPAPPAAASEPRPDPPDVSEAFMASLQSYYVVNTKGGAPAFATPAAAGPPLYTFADGTELKVVDVSTDKRWLTVQLPGNKTGYVSSSIVTSGVRAPR